MIKKKNKVRKLFEQFLYDKAGTIVGVIVSMQDYQELLKKREKNTTNKKQKK